jgi:thiaminase/transcriptional activator TenA
MIKRMKKLSMLLVAVTLSLILSNCDSEGGYSYIQQIWNENCASYLRILNMPFNREVADGTLPEEKFRNYIIQDYFYLQNYKNVYEILLTKSPDDRGTQFIIDTIRGIDEEIEFVHMVYFAKYNVTEEELSHSTPNPTTESYDSYLIETATHEPFEVGLIATLPCNWIYYRVATDMKNSEQAESNPYQDWIDEYGSVAWEESDTKVFVDLVECYMENTTEEIRSEMGQAYKEAVEFEYMFWDAVYNE